MLKPRWGVSTPNRARGVVHCLHTTWLPIMTSSEYSGLVAEKSSMISYKGTVAGEDAQ